jgi:hypothetical protein
MGTDHKENLELLSDTLGNCMRKERIEGGVLADVPARYQLVERKLAHPHQLRELLDPERRWMIVTRAGKPPLLLAIETAEKAVPIWAIEADPNFREPFPAGADAAAAVVAMAAQAAARPRSVFDRRTALCGRTAAAR